MKVFSLIVLIVAADKENAAYRLQSQVDHFANVTIDGSEDELSGRSSRMIRVMDFQYGCHCKFDTSIDEMGAGKSVDGIDSVCRQYKECLKVSPSCHFDSDKTSFSAFAPLTGQHAVQLSSTTILTWSAVVTCHQ